MVRSAGVAHRLFLAAAYYDMQCSVMDAEHKAIKVESQQATPYREASLAIASEGRPAGRPRSSAARRAVLDAAYTILVETGLSGFSVEAVASRSGVARTTIYRSWPTKGLLAMESFREAFAAELDFTSSERPEDDLRGLVRSLTAALGGSAGRLAASVLAEAQSDESVQRQFLDDFSIPLRVRSTALIEAGIRIGRFRDDLDVVSLLDALVGAVYIRLMLGLPLDRDWADKLTATLSHGCLVQTVDAASPGARR